MNTNNYINSITQLAKKLNTNIDNMRITGMPRKLLMAYAFLFILIGLLYIGGILLELWKSGKFNYSAAIQYMQVYFGTSTVITFGILGKAFIDKDNNNIPDVWEQEIENDKSSNKPPMNGPSKLDGMRTIIPNDRLPISNNETDEEPKISKKGDI